MSKISCAKNDIITKVLSKVATIMQLAVGVTSITKDNEDCKGSTIFVEYHGHINALIVRIFIKGWRPNCPPDYDIRINIGDEDQDEVLRKLNKCYDFILDVSGRNKGVEI